MIFHDEKGKYPVVCSFCGAEEECDHLFALYNQNCVEIEKGYVQIHLENIQNLICKQLIMYVRKNNIVTESPFLSEKLNDIWYDIFCCRKDFFSKSGFNENEFKSFVEDISLTEYIMECIDSTEIGELGISESDQPGSSYSFQIFHVEDTNLALSKLLNYIEADFEDSQA